MVFIVAEANLIVATAPIFDLLKRTFASQGKPFLDVLVIRNSASVLVLRVAIVYLKWGSCRASMRLIILLIFVVVFDIIYNFLIHEIHAVWLISLAKQGS